MCIRSKHDAITAWCATAGLCCNANFLSCLPNTAKWTKANSTSYSEVIRSNGPRLYVCSLSFVIVTCLLAISLCPLAISCEPTELEVHHIYSSLETSSRPHGAMKQAPVEVTLQPPSKITQNGKRRDIQDSNRRKLSSDLISVVCDQLPNACARAAFLRLRAYHEVCIHLPLLYLLPYLRNTSEEEEALLSVANRSQLPVCQGTVSGLPLRSTDAVFHTFLDTSQHCRANLEALDEKIKGTLHNDIDRFTEILSRSFCTSFDRPTNRTGDFDCTQCQNAYWSWICSTTFPIFYPLVLLPESTTALFSTPTTATLLPSLTLPSVSGGQHLAASITPSPTTTTTLLTHDNTSLSKLKLPTVYLQSQSDYRLTKIPACQTWCTEVETLCPYLNPGDSSSNGGEPTFLCDESHYYQQPPVDAENPTDDGCEHDCCFTTTDLLVDRTSDNDDATTTTEENSSRPREYFTMAARCFHQLSQHVTTSVGNTDVDAAIGDSNGTTMPPLITWPDPSGAALAAWYQHHHRRRLTGTSSSSHRIAANGWCHLVSVACLILASLGGVDA